MDENIDTTRQAVEEGRQLLAASGSEIARQLSQQAYERCPMHGRHYITMDEFIGMLGSDDSKHPGSIRARLSTGGLFTIKSAYDADELAAFMAHKMPGKAWRAGKKG